MIIIMIITSFIYREITKSRLANFHGRASRPRGCCGSRACLGAKDRTPEIDTSEIILDLHRNCSSDFQWYFPTEFHLCGFWSVICCPEMPQLARQEPT